MSIHLWQAKISKILRSKYPEFGKKLEDFILDLLGKNGLQWADEALFDNNMIVDAVYEEFWNEIEPLSSLSEGRRIAILKNTEGRDEIHLNRELLRAWLREVHEYDGYIQGLDNKELQDLYNHYEQKNPDKSVISRRSQEYEELEFFNNASANADFDYWSIMPIWTVEEAAVLSLNKDPRIVNDDTLKERLSLRYKHLLFVKDLQLRLEIMNRSIEAKELQEPITPSSFAEWASKIPLDVPDAIRLASKSNRKTGSSIEIEQLRLKSIYKLVLGIAVKKFNHKMEGNSPATSQIVGLLEGTEFQVDRKVVLEILRDANRYISDS
ncbi:MAG: hypothetical protein OIF58_01390 [Cohaesibacter sp.]|nr:hypothetical protein [Cohaesibacter sp.]